MNDRGIKVKLDDDVKELLKYFMNSEGVKDSSEAINELLRKVYRCWGLEKQFGESISDRELWDN